MTTGPYDALLATLGVIREGARYYEVHADGRPTCETDEILVVVGPNGRVAWQKAWSDLSGYIAQPGFRRPIPRPTTLILSAMLSVEGGHVFLMHPVSKELTKDESTATGWLDAIDKQAGVAMG